MVDSRSEGTEEELEGWAACEGMAALLSTREKGAAKRALRICARLPLADFGFLYGGNSALRVRGEGLLGQPGYEQAGKVMSRAGYQKHSTSNVAGIGIGIGLGSVRHFRASASGVCQLICVYMIVTKQDRHMVDAGHE